VSDADRDRRDRAPVQRRGADPAPSPRAALQRSLGNQRLLQLRRAVQRQAPQWVRDQLGVTDEDERNAARALAQDQAAEEIALPSGGEALTPEVQRWAERGIGGDLGGVSVVHGSDAACDALGAHAFATPGDSGHQIHLSSQVDLATPDGQFTLLHELAHVRQQRDGQTGDLDGLGGDEARRADLEDHADQVAQRALRTPG
jgi:hypothetical protein